MSVELGPVVATLEVNPEGRAAFEAFLDAQLGDGFVESGLKRRVVERLVELDAPVPVTDAELCPPAVPSSTGRERLAVEYVDHFVAHYQAIPDELWERLRAEFGAPELAELSWTIAVVKGTLRVGAALGVSLDGSRSR